jgi:hypothetical protein
VATQSDEFFSSGIQALVKRWHMVGTMLRSDEVFSILFVHILLVKEILRLLFDSSSYFTYVTGHAVYLLQIEVYCYKTVAPHLSYCTIRNTFLIFYLLKHVTYRKMFQTNIAGRNEFYILQHVPFFYEPFLKKPMKFQLRN